MLEQSGEATQIMSLIARHDSSLVAHAYLFLAKHAFRGGDDDEFKEALRLTTFCRQFPDIRAETTALMQQISSRQNEPKLGNFLLHNSGNNQRLTRAQTRRIAEQFNRTSHDVLGAAEAAAAVVVSASDVLHEDMPPPLPLENVSMLMPAPTAAFGSNPANAGQLPTEGGNSSGSRFASSTPGMAPLAPFSPLSLRRRTAADNSANSSSIMFRRHSIFGSSSSNASSTVAAAGAATAVHMLTPSTSSAVLRSAARHDGYNNFASVENDNSRQLPPYRRRLQQRAYYDLNSTDSASSSDLSGMLDDFHIDTHSNNGNGFEAPANAGGGADAGAAAGVSNPPQNVANSHAGNADVENPVANDVGWEADGVDGDL